MSYRLFLDDERDPPGSARTCTERLKAFLARLLRRSPSEDVAPWIIVRSYDEAVATILTQGMPSHMAFDHDLGLDASGQPARSGYDVAKWIGEYVLDRDGDLDGFTWYAHSQNPAGARNIDGYLANLKAVLHERRSTAGS